MITDLLKCPASDVPFVHRISVILQTLSEDVRSPDLVTDLRQLLDSVKNVPIEEGALKETCPACRVEVPLADVRKAVCSNGHVWSTSYFRLIMILKFSPVCSARCSVTTFILSTAFVRTCIGCKRKAFLPPSAISTKEERVQHLPVLAKGPIVRELLEASQLCLFCGNMFVCIV